MTQDDRDAAPRPEAEEATGEQPADGAPPRDDDAPHSELEEGLAHLGRALGGLTSRLLGERITGIPVPPDRPAVSPEVDAVVEQVGSSLGRLMRATGEGLKRHPTRPLQALDEATRLSREPIETPEGVGPVTVGLRSLASGLGATAEALLDKVAPRRPAGPDTEHAAGKADDGAPTEAPAEAPAEDADEG